MGSTLGCLSSSRQHSQTMICNSLGRCSNLASVVEGPVVKGPSSAEGSSSGIDNSNSQAASSNASCWLDIFGCRNKKRGSNLLLVVVNCRI